MTSDLNSSYVYAFLKNSIYVLSVESRCVAYSLLNIHLQPVTACVWYPLGQFFLTGCRWVSDFTFVLHIIIVYYVPISALSLCLPLSHSLSHTRTQSLSHTHLIFLSLSRSLFLSVKEYSNAYLRLLVYYFNLPYTQLRSQVLYRTLQTLLSYVTYSCQNVIFTLHILINSTSQ